TEHGALTQALADSLPGWVSTQRWYAGKGHLPQLRRIGARSWPDPTGEAGIEVHLVLDTAGGRHTVYQMPFTIRRAPLAGAEQALVATRAGSAPDTNGATYVYDGPHDPVYATALMAAIGGHEIAMTASRVLRGEQSNTSIIIDGLAPDGSAHPVIAKIYRVLHHGENPDVIIQSALAAAGCDRVPAPIGSIEGSWPDASVDGGRARGHLAFVQEFLAGTQDAWRVAAHALAEGSDFTTAAHALGAATAEVHQTLARALETREATPEDRRALVRTWRTRHTTAVSEVPALAEHDAVIRAVYDEAGVAPWPALQRVHGDYHLGQVLDAPGRGWVLLDFEGEPLRPLSERSQPDLALRDVAGMLRSFDYAAGAHVMAHPQDDELASAWAAACREAFLDGYADVAADPRDEAVLLAALELDKALYEVVYEARNRPRWLPIPGQAVERIVASRKAPG
ncbi:MAG TPA: hypothetical protein VHM65_08865, partial [Candidatus Lustribacter sp.]|nr:hypothetical protein [Candidatus Lustribacter sp.]